MLIGTDKFGGIAPRIASHLLPNEGAGSASNVKIESGALQAYGSLTALGGVTVAQDAKTIYRNPASNLWHSFLHVTDIVRSPLANDAYDRIYWTDDHDGNAPKMAANDSFNTPYLLGIPTPPAAPTVTYTGTVGADPLLAETRAYVTTFVSAYAEEGPPSPASQPVTVYPDEETYSVTVSIPTAPTGNYNVTHVRIYRTNTGSTGTEYQLVTQVAVGSADFVDSVSVANLGVVLPSTDWDVPPETLKGLKSHPAGFLVGFTGNELCLSEKWLPHAWPLGNRYPVTNDMIVAVGLYGSTILVMTTGLPFIVTGEDPGAMMVEKLEVGDNCMAKRGVVDMGYFILYPGSEGLVAVGVGEVPRVITEPIVDPETWQSYNPSEMVAERVGNRYFCVCGSGSPIVGFIFDPKTLDFMPITTTAKALFFDSEVGKLYLRRGTSTFVEAWDTGGKIAYTWRSKNFRIPYPVNMSCAHVFADAYPVTFRLYTDGTLRHERVVNNGFPFRLPSGYQSERYSFEVSSTNTVTAVMAATAMEKLGEA